MKLYQDEREGILLAFAEAAVIEFHRSLSHVEYSRGWESFGYASPPAGTPSAWFFDRVSTADRDRIRQALHTIAREGADPMDTGFRLQAADGSLPYVTFRSFAYSPEGRILLCVRSHRLMSRFFVTNPQPIWVFDVDTLRFLAVNDAAVQLYGYTEQEFLSMTLLDIRPQEDRERVLAAVRGPSRDHEGHLVWRHLRKSGEVLYVEVRTQESEYTGHRARISMMTDVTARILSEQRSRLSDRLDALGQFSSSIAHDFNNLLTIINGYSGLLLSRLEANSPHRQDLAAVAEAGRRAAALTSQLLTFAQKRVIEPRATAVDAVLRSTIPLIQRLLPGNIRIESWVRCEDSSVWLDQTQLEQILMNLCLNARDAMPDGGVLWVESALEVIGPHSTADSPPLPAGEYVALTIRDEGIGMPPEVLQHVFEPFYSQKPKGKGTGLGLATVYGIVRAAGGHIRLTSTPGAGTQFVILLPKAEALLPDPAPSEPLPLPPSAQGEIVLLAEDNPGVAQLERDVLERAGYQVLVARSHQEAASIGLDLQVPLAALVTDLHLGSESGEALSERIRLARPGLPVLLISGTPNFSTGFGSRLNFELLEKPFSPDELVRRLAHLLRPPQPQAKCILIAEDEQDIRRLIRSRLEQAGFSVLEASNGKEVISVMESATVDLLITDLVMPEREGLETITEVRSRWPHVPLVAVSGAFAGQYLAIAKMFGANLALTKPLDLDLLVSRIQQLLKSPIPNTPFPNTP